MAIEYDFLLLETGSYLLLEDGGKIIIDERVIPDSVGGGGGGYYERRTLIPMPAPLPRMRRRYGWVDIEDEELLLIIDDLEIV